MSKVAFTTIEFVGKSFEMTTQTKAKSKGNPNMNMGTIALCSLAWPSRGTDIFEDEASDIHFLPSL
jgi:hypothetical protein